MSILFVDLLYFIILTGNGVNIVKSIDTITVSRCGGKEYAGTFLQKTRGQETGDISSKDPGTRDPGHFFRYAIQNKGDTGKSGHI